MPAGTRRFKVTIQQETLTDDASGQPLHTWSTFCSRFADVVATGGAERARGRQVQASMSHVIELLADSQTREITAGMRVLWQGRIINLLVARPLDGQLRKIQLQGMEVIQT
jgi:SPP1 family predicted phage head-tail adaptor